jgi:hypothetical protein
MPRDIHRRVAALEARHNVSSPKFEVWINEGDGLLRGPTGQVMTQEAFNAEFPNARRFTLDIFGDGRSANAMRYRPPGGNALAGSLRARGPYPKRV